MTATPYDSTGSGQDGITVPRGLERPYALVGPALDQVTSLLLCQSEHRHPFIDRIMRYSFKLGGKRLRPMLVLLTGMACGPLCDEHRYAAAALELIHTGTLVHDDILDGARFRRHLETIHLKWDTQIAVLAGDLLLTQAMELMTRCDNMESWRMVSDACKTTCEGELTQNGDRYRFDMTREEYFRIIGGKTAALLRCACRLGPLFAGVAAPLVEKFGEFGNSLGLAFQIVDDILDLVGDENKMGKTLGTDILNGKPTLPLILWFERADADEREHMIATITGPGSDSGRIDRVASILKESGTIADALDVGRALVQTALDALVPEPILHDASGAPAVPLLALGDLAKFVTDRNL